METILEEIIVHFRPEPEEELHSAVHALLIKCFQVHHSSAIFRRMYDGGVGGGELGVESRDPGVDERISWDGAACVLCDNNKLQFLFCGIQCSVIKGASF